MKENVMKGINIGFVLLISSILTLRLTNDIEGVIKVFNYFIPILIGYGLLGVLIQWIRNLPHKSSEGSMGVGIYYWIFIIVIFISVIGNFIPDYIRYIILVNIVVLIALWIFDYILLGKVAKELNGEESHKYNTLLIDLKEKPRTKEEFFKVLEEYCISNKILLEYVEKDLPAIVKMNKNLNKVEIGYYFDVSGATIYTLKITEL